MEPPSTPSPYAARGRLLDDMLRAVEPARPSCDDEPAPATERDPRLALAAAERFLEEQRASAGERGKHDAAGSNGPPTMRGDALAVALELARSSRVRVKH